MDGWDMFNVGRSTQWAFAGGTGLNLKADSATIGLAILILRQVARPSNTPLEVSRMLLGHHFAKVPPQVLLTGNLEDIAPTTDFTCTRCP